MDNAAFVRSEMERFTGKTLVGKHRILIRCPFHKDDTPSLAVTLVNGRGSPGQFSCFGCKEKGQWNALALRLNLQPMDPNAFESEWTGRPKKDFFTSISLETLFNEWQFQQTALTKGYSFRGIEYPLLNALHAVSGRDGFGVSCTIFPLWVGGELVGGIKAKNRPRPKDGLKYLNSKGEWSRTSGLFPLHCFPQWPRVILVEGPRDALTLLQYGLPALAILGASNWCDQKRNLLLASSVKQVIVAFDGDAAGREGASIVMASLKGLVPRAKVILPPGQDPGSLPKSFWQETIPQWFNNIPAIGF